jgi:thiamine biosynthesis lipoprotein
MSQLATDYEVVAHSAPSMGGTLNVFVAAPPAQAVAAQTAARRTAQRVETWAARLTRFDPTSELSRLNRSADADVAVRPTLAAALGWAKLAERRSENVVDATQLDARLAAESGTAAAAVSQSADRSWHLAHHARGGVVRRDPSIRIDLDGTAKGWIADRAADLLGYWPGVLVDADGDIALHAAPGVEWLIDVADPRQDPAGHDRAPLSTLRLRGGEAWSATYGVATSGTSVHRWQLVDGRSTHHLIDPRTGQPALTDVVQATIVAPSAREAEMIAKSAVILGSRDALGFLVRSAALAAILLFDSDELAAMPGTETWLA